MTAKPKRGAAVERGGASSSPILMAIQVEPQMIAMLNTPSQINDTEGSRRHLRHRSILVIDQSQSSNALSEFI